jgi:hypothetical protein
MPGCPIVMDTTGRGYKLTSAADGVLFDLNADGITGLISWTDSQRDVAFLALDRNGNGRIDDGEELFGSFTPLEPGSAKRGMNGFDALAALEGSAYGPSLEDGIIDARDSAYSKLLLWIDRNHDGTAQSGELSTATSQGLIAIETQYRESKRRDRHGNEFRLRGISWWLTPSGGLRARFFYDVWLVGHRAQ